MITRMYAVYDKAVGAYLQPFFLRSNGEAIRSFTDACSDGKMAFCKTPEDFTLFFLGEFDDATAMVSVPDVPQRLISALECVKVVDMPVADLSAATAASVDRLKRNMR